MAEQEDSVVEGEVSVVEGEVSVVEGDQIVVEGEQAATAVELLIAEVTGCLSMPDLMGVVMGNWVVMEKVREPLASRALALMGGTDNEQNRVDLSDELAVGLEDMVLSEEALQSVKGQMEPGVDINAVSHSFLRVQLKQLVGLILDDAGTGSFGPKLKEWAVVTGGGWVDLLCTCFVDGLVSVEKVVQFAVSSQLSVVGPEMSFMLPMASSMISKVLIKARDDFQRRGQTTLRQTSWGQTRLSQTTLGVENSWQQHLPEQDRARWQATLERDAKVQEQMVIETKQWLNPPPTLRGKVVCQRPLSDAYLSGSKRRKLTAGTKAQSSAARTTSTSQPEEKQQQVSDLLHDNLTRAIADSGSSATSTDALGESLTRELESHSVLGRSFQTQLATDLRKRSLADPDFDSDAMPFTKNLADRTL